MQTLKTDKTARISEGMLSFIAAQMMRSLFCSTGISAIVANPGSFRIVLKNSMTRAVLFILENYATVYSGCCFTKLIGISVSNHIYCDTDMFWPKTIHMALTENPKQTI